ncbi:hypothetical protein C8A00DRAFT_36992 [Chaetomidium leptoderma]|uniref:Uncharacterized protein n=1 Tax=Chaetomidium leptoderma TaxID=669021 RepID=A0AAN6ZVI5_9PEZI|nr:hypothetical protein C8A00DRAFT_36992 [Chaetomidium leptoderma]
MPKNQYGPADKAAVWGEDVDQNRSNPRPKAISDVIVHFWKKDSMDRREALAMFDNGNRFGPLIALGTALRLGFRLRDFADNSRVLQGIGGVEIITAGSIKVRYYLDDDHDRLHETDFHVLENLAGDYEANLPTEDIVEDPNVVPLVAITVAKKRAPTEEELKSLEDRIREAEKAADRAEKERETRKAAEKDKRAKGKGKATA